MKRAVLRALVFLLLAGFPTVLFDLVYWQAPLPSALVTPVEVALRLALTALLGELAERHAPRGFAVPLVFLVAVLTNVFGMAEAEYLRGIVEFGTPRAGLEAMRALELRVAGHPRYFVALLALVSIPYAASTLTRVRPMRLREEAAIAPIVTLVMVVLTLEPLRLDVGRVMAAFVCLRTLYVALALPFVDRATDRFVRRDELSSNA
jgi:hypothetical protein